MRVKSSDLCVECNWDRRLAFLEHSIPFSSKLDWVGRLAFACFALVWDGGMDGKRLLWQHEERKERQGQEKR